MPIDPQLPLPPSPFFNPKDTPGVFDPAGVTTSTGVWWDMLQTLRNQMTKIRKREDELQRPLISDEERNQIDASMAQILERALEDDRQKMRQPVPNPLLMPKPMPPLMEF